MRDLKYSEGLHAKAKSDAVVQIRAERSLVATLVEIDHDRTFELFGETHLTPYCIKHLGLDESIAECLVRIVRKSHEVPELAQAVVRGEVSVTKAKAIASVITPENSDEWIAKASTLPKSKLEREVSKASGSELKRVSLGLAFDTYDKFNRARDILSSKSEKFASLEDTLDWALDELLQRHDPVEKAERYEKRSRGHSVLEHEVVLRDQEQCQWIHEDGAQCSERKWLHKHHIIHREHGGPDTLDNLVTLCSGHHRMMHRN